MTKHSSESVSIYVTAFYTRKVGRNMHIKQGKATNKTCLPNCTSFPSNFNMQPEDVKKCYKIHKISRLTSSIFRNTGWAIHCKRADFSDDAESSSSRSINSKVWRKLHSRFTSTIYNKLAKTQTFVQTHTFFVTWSKYFAFCNEHFWTLIKVSTG